MLISGINLKKNPNTGSEASESDSGVSFVFSCPGFITGENSGAIEDSDLEGCEGRD